MAAKKGGDSKQGLIIALVIMFLLCIGLGVGTYYGFADQDRLTADRKKAEAAEKKAKESRDWEKYQNLFLKSYVGHPLSKDEQDDLASLQEKYDSGTLGRDEPTKAGFDALVTKLQKDPNLGWDPAKKQPVTTLFARIEALETAANQARQAQAKAEADAKKALAEKNRELDETVKERDTLKQTVKNMREKEIPQLATAWQQGAFAKNLEQLERLTNDLEDLKKKMENGKEDAKKAVDRLTKEINDQKLQITKLNDQIKPVNVLDSDRPKGKILNVEASGSVAYVNLGSADHVKPQLTFSIYGAESNGLASHHRKGALEITKVLGPHMAQARITEKTDGNRDPILTGDLLFNPAWNASLRQHVAVAGLIDLIGDGSNNTQEFLRTLRDQGIVIDAYLDLKDMTIKGEGITAKTQYLVMGDQPEANADFLGSDIRTDRKMEMWKKMKEMRDEATRLGVTVVPYRRFLSVIGYPMPRVLASRPGSSFLESPLLGAGMKEAPKEGAKGGKDKGKEPKDTGKEKEK